MTVKDVLDKFSFTKSHMSYFNIESKYGTKEYHIDEITFIPQYIKDAEILSIDTINKPDGSYTKTILELYIKA